jgi:hypothetical protein
MAEIAEDPVPNTDAVRAKLAEIKRRKEAGNLPWTILGRPDLIRQVKQLAEDLSLPRAKVSVAALRLGGHVLANPNCGTRRDAARWRRLVL